MLAPEYSSAFMRDVKKLTKKHVDTSPLREVMALVLADTPESDVILKQRHNMHELRGNWSGSSECHVANIGDWLLIWRVGNGVAVFQRTGSHDELFR